MGFLKSKKVGNNFEREWASSTFKPVSESLTQSGLDSYNLFNQAMQGGEGAANAYQAYRNSTGFNNILGDAMRGVSGSSAARGLLASGSTARALQTNAANLGQQNYSNWLSQLLSGATTGLNSGNQAAQTMLGANTYQRKGGLNDFLGSAGQLASGIGSMIPGGR